MTKTIEEKALQAIPRAGILDTAAVLIDVVLLEKRSALAHFEPNISLLSRGPERERRRRLSDEALESNARVHSHAIAFAKIIDDEVEALLGAASDQLDWRSFESCWRRALRQIVFGVSARDDQEMTEQLEQLRAAANWAFLKPKKTALLAEFQKRVSERIAAAPPNSLAGRIPVRGYGEADAPADQVTHWLFASDAAAIGAFRALALIAGHSEAEELARQEARGQTGSAVYPYIRAAMLESLRLWPTAPTLFRETTTQTGCGRWSLPSHTHLFIFLPYFHRDDTRLPFANRFAPELWLDGRSGDSLTLIPFSAGPAKCPAHQLAPLLGSCMLASLLRRANFKQAMPLQLDGRAPMPPTLNHFRLRFDMTRT